VPENPQRIVSLAPSITEIIFSLGQETRLKGVTQFSNFPPKAKLLPRVGSYIHLDLEKIVALRPDLCIATKDGNPVDVIKRLDGFEIPVYAVNPKDLKSVMRTVLEIGNLIGSEEKAEELTEIMQKRINYVKNLVAQTKSRPGIFFQIGISPVVSVGTDTFANELIEIAGGRNLTKGPVPYPRFNSEQILALNPDIIIITTMARGSQDIFKRAKREWMKWKNISAVQNNRIFLVNSNLFDRPTPRLIRGLELLLKIIHPELIEGKIE